MKKPLLSALFIAIVLGATSVDGAAAPKAGPTPAQAAATRTFTFYGSGWGHGIGMSQWGAYGLASRGRSHGAILRHFYRGVRLGGPPGGSPSRFRVGLTWTRPRLRLTAVAGPVGLRFGSPSRPVRFRIPQGSTWTVGSRRGRFNLFNGNGKKVASLGSPSWKLFVTYQSMHSRVFIPAAGHSYGRGYVELNVYRGCPGCAWRLRAIAVVRPQQYLYGLGEVPSSWPMEAMRAQADAGRTYAFDRVLARGQHLSPCNCGLYASTVDQVYLGYDKELAGAGWIRAVNSTAGEVILYGGRPISAFYFSTSGGHTESIQNVWFTSPVPYLRGVCDPGDYTAANPLRTWLTRITGASLGSHLASAGLRVGTITGFTNIQRGPSGRIMRVTVRGTSGSVRITGSQLKASLGLRDSKVWINHDLNVVGAIRARYDALGCRPGLPTTPRQGVPGGSRQRFHQGAIYRNNRATLTVWLRGTVYRKYVREGGAVGMLGLPRSPIQQVGNTGGNRLLLQHGRIYGKPRAGVHELHGRVLHSYLGRGGPFGRLAYPTSDVRRYSAGVMASFQRGTILCPTGARCRLR